MDDKTPIEAEAAADPTVAVEWRGLSFEVPRDRADWPLDAELAARHGDTVAFCQAIMDAETFAALRLLQPKNRDVAELADEIVKALGFKDAGESPASSA